MGNPFEDWWNIALDYLQQLVCCQQPPSLILHCTIGVLGMSTTPSSDKSPLVPPFLTSDHEGHMLIEAPSIRLGKNRVRGKSGAITANGSSTSMYCGTCKSYLWPPCGIVGEKMPHQEMLLIRRAYESNWTTNYHSLPRFCQVTGPLWLYMKVRVLKKILPIAHGLYWVPKLLVSSTILAKI